MKFLGCVLQLCLGCLPAACASGCRQIAPPPTAAAVAPAPDTVAGRRIDASAAELLPASTTDVASGTYGANLWDDPSRQPPRTSAQRGTRGPSGDLTLHDGASFVLALPTRTIGRLRLTFTGTVTGTAADVVLFAPWTPPPQLSELPALPAGMMAKLAAPLASARWAPGAAAPVVEVTPEKRSTWLLVILRSARGGKATLARLQVDELLPAGSARHAVGGETRPALPVAAGSTHCFELPAAPAGAVVELAVAPPEDAAPLATPMVVRVSSAAAQPNSRSWQFEDSSGAPLRRFEEGRLDFPRGSPGTTRIDVTVEGPSGSVALVALPRLLPARDAPMPMNLLLISIDTLRADHVGAYGSQLGATPNLDRFAATSVLFRRCSSPANFTFPAHATMMTGLQPSVHGADRYGERVSIRPWPNLAGAFAESGAITAAFTGGGFVDASFGFDEHFDRYGMLDPLMTPENPRYATQPRRGEPDWNRRLRAGASLAQISGWLADHADRRFFLFFHTYHAHDYLPSAASAQRFGVDPQAKFPTPMELQERGVPRLARGSPQLEHYQSLYTASIWDADQAVGTLLDTLERTGLAASTIVVITADHGEAFGEHDSLFHATGLHEEVLHVPLLVRVPGCENFREIDLPVGLVDLAPTLLELCELPPLPQTQGTSLAPLLRGEEPSPALSERFLVAQDCPSDGLTHSALIGPRWKLLRRALDREDHFREELYDLLADPREEEDLASRGPLTGVLASARAALDRMLASLAEAAARARVPRAEVELPGHVMEDLEQLGYPKGR